MKEKDVQNKVKTKPNGVKTKKKMGKVGKIVLIVVLVLVILLGIGAGIGVWYVSDKLGKVNYVEIDENEIEVNEGVDDNLNGYRTIAIFGVDSRSNEIVKGTRSDCVILATIDEKTKEVKLTSVYRDTYLEITGRGLDKLTHAYAYGGASLAMSTLNTNLDLNIKEFITVNFESVVDIVNAVGGVSISITNEELKYINDYIDEINKVTKNNASHVTKAGTQSLNGVQALAYGRIRYTSGGDYKRTERMRDVMMAVLGKAKKMSVSQLNALADKLLPIVYTNIQGGEIISLIPQLATYKITDSTGWPYNTKGATINGVWYGPPITLESNVRELHQKVYGQTDYEPTAKVKEISNKIIKKTGYNK
ncbi:MAG: LytR family transcriptional regulator [Clostridia bacterium]|nr:LytR family transcriptional regulator [Clostridia bacterium]